MGRIIIWTAIELAVAYFYITWFMGIADTTLYAKALGLVVIMNLAGYAEGAFSRR